MTKLGIDNCIQKPFHSHQLVVKEQIKILGKYKFLKSLDCDVTLPSHVDKNHFKIALGGSFNNSNKNSLLRKIHIDAAAYLFVSSAGTHSCVNALENLSDLSHVSKLNRLAC